MKPMQRLSSTVSCFVEDRPVVSELFMDRLYRSRLLAGSAGATR
jgi:hypothetical protein